MANKTLSLLKLLHHHLFTKVIKSHNRSRNQYQDPKPKHLLRLSSCYISSSEPSQHYDVGSIILQLKIMMKKKKRICIKLSYLCKLVQWLSLVTNHTSQMSLLCRRTLFARDSFSLIIVGRRGISYASKKKFFFTVKIEFSLQKCGSSE